MITNFDELIDSIYNEMIGIVLKGLDSKYELIVKGKYRDMLIERFSRRKDSIQDFNLSYKRFLYSEHIKWDNMPTYFKLDLFVVDDNLNKIIDISAKAFTYAQDKLYNNKMISEEEANTLINALDGLCDKVFDYHRELARSYVSECTMDLLYASRETDYMSFRTSHLRPPLKTHLPV